MALAIAALGAGYFLFGWLPTGFRPWERWTLAFGGGWGLLSLVLYLIGQFNFSRRLILVVVFLFALVGPECCGVDSARANFALFE